MKAVLKEERPTLKPLMQQIHQMDQQLKQYVEGTYDAAKVQALVAQQSQTLVQLKVEETKVHGELYQLLTPDQQAKLKELEANREARRQQHMQNGSEEAAPEDAPAAVVLYAWAPVNPRRGGPHFSLLSREVGPSRRNGHGFSSSFYLRRGLAIFRRMGTRTRAHGLDCFRPRSRCSPHLCSK